MNMPAIITDNTQRVKEALEIWAEWMQVDNAKLGYPSKSLGMVGEGGWGSFIEDQADIQDNRLAEAVDTIVDDMTASMRTAVYHFNIAAVFTSRRTRIEDDYADALMVLEFKLRQKDLL